MNQYQLMQIMRELGYTENFIREVLSLKVREQEYGIWRAWEEYLPRWYGKEEKPL